MKILYVVKTSDGAVWAFRQAEWLKAHGEDIVAVLPAEHGRVADRYRAIGIPVETADLSLPVTHPWRLGQVRRRFRELVEKHHPDIVHCQFVTNIMTARLSLKKYPIPRLFQVPGPLHLEMGLYRSAEIRLSNRDDYWIGTCRKTVDIYRTHKVDPSHLFLAYYGGYGGKDCDEYAQEGHKLRDEWAIPPDRKLIGMVSYFYKPRKMLLQKRGIKGHEDFIDGMALLLESHPEAVGVIIGGPWGRSEAYAESVRAYARKKCGDRIIFTGFRTDLKDIYHELDVVVHPSHSENLGGAAESLAAAVPTVATRVGGFPDIVQDHKTGLLVPSEDPAAIRDAVAYLLDHPDEAKAMAEEGRRLVRELLDVETCSADVQNIYREILRSRKETV